MGAGEAYSERDVMLTGSPIGVLLGTGSWLGARPRVTVLAYCEPAVSSLGVGWNSIWDHEWELTRRPVRAHVGVGWELTLSQLLAHWEVVGSQNWILL